MRWISQVAFLLTLVAFTSMACAPRATMRRSPTTRTYTEDDAVPLSEERRGPTPAVVLKPGETATVRASATTPSGEKVDFTALVEAEEAPPVTPWYKKGWVWALIGVAVVGTAVGIGCGVGDCKLPCDDAGESGTITIR